MNNKPKLWSGALTALLAAGGMAASSSAVYADVSVGAGMRTSLSMVENAAPSGTDDSSDYALDSIRLYVSGEVQDNIKFTFNTERDASGDINVMDGIAQFEFSDMFNVWVGRFLPPSDRSNLSGPYYLNAWNFPIAQAYPAIIAGRDDGAAIWGQKNGGELKYQVGFFEGTGDVAGGPNQEDNMMLAGRVVYNFLDPEPGYYNSSTYYGSKDILAVGAVIMTQSDALGTAAAPGDFTGTSLDVLYEKKQANGAVATVEAAFYDYDRDNVAADSDGYFVLGSYLMPQSSGMGQWQPMVRVQNLNITGGADTDVTDIGLNYIIDGHNARISFVYSNTDVSGGTDTAAFQIGAQLQM